MIGYRTIQAGQRVAVWNAKGAVRFVDGPKRLWLFRELVQPLPRYLAEANQYLVIQHADGHAEHVPGPSAVWLDPVEHTSIEVAEARSVKADEAVVVYRRNGEDVARRRVEGPAVLVPEENEWVRPLPRYLAEADEYLAVQHADGHSEHVRGPASIWFDPVEHTSIEVAKALPVNAHEAVVVYRREEDQAVTRRVVHGPAVFVPDEHEWLHDFRWHGADPKNPERKVPRALRFEKLRIIPDQMYFDVPEVRTADDALLVVRLMVFFELVDIETMLDQTHDPIADFINALSADVIDFVGATSFEAFKARTEALNELEAYPNLTERAARIGYRINNVVYRGYTAGPTLQVMHDNAIETRTQLKLEAETEQQAQDLADLKQRRAGEREVEARRLEAEKVEHQLALQRQAHEETLRAADREHRQDAEHRTRLNGIELDRLREKNQEDAGFLEAMRKLDIDLTQYLVAQQRNPDRTIRVEGEGGARLHLHEAEEVSR